MKTAVILHGWASNPAHWVKFQSRLKAEGFKVLKPDLPGFKTVISRPFNTQDYVDWFKKNLSGKGKMILIGQSFGGQVAIQFTAQNPGSVERLVLIGSAGIRKEFNLKKQVFWLLAKTGKVLTASSLAKKILYRLAREWDYTKASPIMKKTLQNIVKDDQRGNLPKIKVPTLLIWGSDDRYTPLRHGRLMNKLIAGSTLKVIAGGRHGLHFTHPRKLIKIIAKFING